MKVRLLIIFVSAIFIVGFLFYQYISYSQNKLTVVFCNVGQGDGIYIRTPKGHDILIDAGVDDSILKCLGRHMPLWDRTIEIAFATHPDADHIGGYSYVLDAYTIKLYNTSRKIRGTDLFKLISEKLESKNVHVRYLHAGDVYKLDDNLSIKTYWPTEEFIKSKESDVNKYSLIQMLNFYSFNILLTGDADFDIVDEILLSIKKENIDIEVFKLPHHGSKTGIGQETLAKASPMLGVISAGANNRYGHPHPYVIEQLKKHAVSFVESKEGDIKILTDGNNWNVIQAKNR